MIKKKILDNLKKIVIAVTCIVTIVSIMPKKVDAEGLEMKGWLNNKVVKSATSVLSDIAKDFIYLLLAIPDGVLHIGDVYLAGNNEPSWYKSSSADGDVEFKIFNFYVTPYKIFTSGTYKEVNDYYEVNMGIFDINFFSDKEIKSSNSESMVASSKLAPAIGNVYYGLRTLATVLMMLVLVYIGIKILISSISEDQAKYKKMLVDWVVALCLLFIMHYIMTAIVNLNSTIIGLIKNDEGDSYYICTDTKLDYDGNTEMTRERAIQLNFNDPEVFGEDDKNIIDLTKGSHKNYCGQSINGENNDGTIDITKWGKNGVVAPNAFFIIEPDRVNSIYKVNIMSYVRSIAGATLKDADKVYIIGNNNFNQASGNDEMGYTVLYLVLMIETVMFIIIYIKRVIQLAFLTMIAPIVAFMYPLDKIGDGKAQSFNQWFKDYLFGVLIQPMHLLLYTIFIYAAGQLFQRNIIYAIAIYAYMITAEKYFKKILGFEKASSGAATGILGGALGAGLAMGGLSKLAGIGPGGHGPKPGGGKDGNEPKTHKIRKLKPSELNGGSPASSGARPNSGGSGSAGNRNKPNAPAPNANGSKKVGILGSTSNVLGRKINSALSGGKYTSRAPGYARAVAGNLIGKGIRGGARIVGTVGMGGTGLLVGTASAIINGKPEDVLKGALIGAKAGDKWFGAAGNTITNIGSGISNFADEVNFERAKTDDDVARRLRERDALIQYQDELADCTSEDREKYVDAIKQMSAYTDFKSFDDVKAMADTIKIAKDNGQGSDDDAILNMYKEAKKWNGMETNSQMQETYKQCIDDEVRQQLGGVGNQEKINDLNYEKRKNEEEKKKLEKEIRLKGSTTARQNELNRINSELSRINTDLNDANAIEAPIEAEKQRRIDNIIKIDQNF